MTVPLIPISAPAHTPIGSWSSSRLAKRSPSRAPHSRSVRTLSPIKAGEPESNLTSNISPDPLWSALVDLLPGGVLVVSHHLRPVYVNSKAKELCQRLSHSAQQTDYRLPEAVSEACHQLIKEGINKTESLVVEYSEEQGRTIRLRLCWFSKARTSERQSNQPYILVLLEDCHEVLSEELCLDRKKYELTEREAEIWMLLRQEYTYQEIAEFLQISLNTVKTHVKNVYAKRRSTVGQRKIWYFK